MTFVENEGVGGWPQLHPQLSPSPASLTHLVFTDIFDRGAKNDEDSRARRMICVASQSVDFFDNSFPVRLREQTFKEERESTLVGGSSLSARCFSWNLQRNHEVARASKPPFLRSFPICRALSQRQKKREPS